MKNIIKKNNCRLCNSKNIYKLFELCKSPLANNLAKSLNQSINSLKFPLNIMKCTKCHHVQLEHVVNQKKLYDQYLYMTGISKNFRNHFKEYSNKIISRFKQSNNLKVLEIGSNDCTLLDFFKLKKCKTVGIEPAKNLYKLTNKKHKIINDYYNSKTNKILKNHYGKFDLIIANNVFAHIDNLKSVFILLSSIMHNQSLIVFEVSYLLDVIKKRLFDTIYHEHLDYHSISPLLPFFKKYKLKIIDIKNIESHGGSIRLFVSKLTSNRKTNYTNINKLIKKESVYNLKNINTFLKFYSDLKKQRKKLNDFFIKNKKKTIYGYGAPAKAVTLINFFELDHNNIKLIIDDSPLKQRKYVPGSKIKIYDSKILIKKPPKIIVILAWNLYEDILKKVKKIKKIDYAIIPLPKFKIIKL